MRKAHVLGCSSRLRARGHVAAPAVALHLQVCNARPCPWSCARPCAVLLPLPAFAFSPVAYSCLQLFVASPLISHGTLCPPLQACRTEAAAGISAAPPGGME